MGTLELWRFLRLAWGLRKSSDVSTADPMKTFLNLCCAMCMVCLVSFAARDLEIWIPAGVAKKTEGRVSRKISSIETVAFNPHARSKVVQYFDTYRTDPLGLPPECAARVKVDEIPAAWENPGITSGMVIQENERSSLVEAPPELVRVLPAHSQEQVRYYLAGSNLVAVDSGYKILDAVRIPTVRLSNEGGAVERGEVLRLVNHLGGRGQ